MRFTKIGLLTFGLGLTLGLVAVAAEIKSLDRVASGLMALGIAALPVGMAVDWRRAVTAPRHPPQRRAKAPVRRGARAARPARKSASSKR